MRLEFPAQVVAGHEVAKARVERADVVILKVDLDEGLPVVVALVHLDVVELVAFKAQFVLRAHAGQVGGNVAAVVFKQKTIPFAQLVVVEVQAGVVGKMRCAQQLALGRIGPAVQGTDDVATGGGAVLRQMATSFQHDRLAVPTDVGDQPDPVRGVHQRPALVFLRQGIKVSGLGHAQAMPDVAGPLLKQDLHLAPIQRFVKISRNRKLTLSLLQLKT